jgi:hypothetical protein
MVSRPAVKDEAKKNCTDFGIACFDLLAFSAEINLTGTNFIQVSINLAPY